MMVFLILKISSVLSQDDIIGYRLQGIGMVERVVELESDHTILFVLNKKYNGFHLRVYDSSCYTKKPLSYLFFTVYEDAVQVCEPIKNLHVRIPNQYKDGVYYIEVAPCTEIPKQHPSTVAVIKYENHLYIAEH